MSLAKLILRPASVVLPLALFGLAGCADQLISARVGADLIAFAEPSAVAHCKPLGGTTVSVLSSVAFYTRSNQAVEDNLDKLARNAAIDADGDTLVRGNSSEYGKRSYSIYKCR